MKVTRRTTLPELLKGAVGAVVAALVPQCRFDRGLFVIGHMRCGSTALSNILVTRPDISGYGEAHIAYRDRGALGILLLNQWRRGRWRPGAAALFDKILHDRYDAEACDGFFGARAIFVARAPAATLPSIRALFAAIGSNEYATDLACAEYYAARMATMRRLWDRFPGDRRVAMTYEALTAEPEAQLARVSAILRLTPPLANSYVANRAAAARGAGDPLAAPGRDRIVAARAEPARRLDLPADVTVRLATLYADFADLAAASAPAHCTAPPAPV
jgi:hypothetical protein